MRDISNPILFTDACDQFEAEILPFIQRSTSRTESLTGPRAARAGTTGPICSARTD